MQKKNFGLIGYPLGHSISPVIHEAFMRFAGVDGKYTRYPVKPEELEKSDWVFDLDGFNVTIPHKTDIIHLLDELDEKAELFGAVNTVKTENGKRKGYNTDCEGFLRALDAMDTKLEGDVLVLGSGGVSRMFAFEAALAGANLTIASRNLITAEKIKDEINSKLGKDCRIITLDEVKGGYSLIINGTPVGMSPNTDDCPISEEAVAASHAVFDAIYKPPETVLLKHARKNGVKNMNGLLMLVWQAAVAEEIWNGVKFTDEQVKKVIDSI